MGENQGWQVGELWEVDESRQFLRCVDIWHTDDFAEPSTSTSGAPCASRPTSTWPGASGSGTCRSGSPTSPRSRRCRWRCCAKDTGLHGAFAIPLRNGPEVIGVMAFYSSEMRQANDDHLSMLSALGGQIGQFMERKRMEQGLRDSEERYRSVIAALDEGIILVDAAGGCWPPTPAPSASWRARRSRCVGLARRRGVRVGRRRGRATGRRRRPAVPGHAAHGRAAAELRPRRDPEGRQPRLDLDELAAAGAIRRAARPTRRWRRSPTSRRARRPRSRCARLTRSWRRASRSAPAS